MKNNDTCSAPTIQSPSESVHPAYIPHTPSLHIRTHPCRRYIPNETPKTRRAHGSELKRDCDTSGTHVCAFCPCGGPGSLVLRLGRFVGTVGSWMNANAGGTMRRATTGGWRACMRVGVYAPQLNVRRRLFESTRAASTWRSVGAWRHISNSPSARPHSGQNRNPNPPSSSPESPPVQRTPRAASQPLPSASP